VLEQNKLELKNYEDQVEIELPKMEKEKNMPKEEKKK
jgi:hypothetical protein